jgi:alpha-L-fucosidase
MLMKSLNLLLVLCIQVICCFGQQAPKPYGVLPSKSQLNWHEVEMYCIIHFGVDTYTDKEWGFGDEDPKILNPVKFDALQIVGAAKAGGFKGIIVVAKHHDGLCIWPTKTTEHNISHTPWRNGKGDMVKEYQLACEKLGMQMGLYCSPWDRNSAVYGKPEYVDLYRKQLRELYTNYGKLFMSWHDGANGGDGYYGGANEVRKIDRTTYYNWPVNWAITRKMQPTANLFGDVGPDVRWVGNEEGHAGETSWATYTPTAPDPGKTPANGYVNSLEGIEGTRNGKFWMPAECDVSLRPGWFYHASQNNQVKSPYTLMDLYYKSVGRGANLDLGLSPNRDGLLDQEDVVSLREFGNLLKQTFKVNLARGAKLTASNVRGSNAKLYGPQFLTDPDRYTYWASDDAVHTPSLIIGLPVAKSFNVIRLRENIKLGQRIEAVEVDAFIDQKWLKIASATSIGANRLIRLPQIVTTNKVRLRVTKSPVGIALSDFGLYKEPARLVAPVISHDKKSMVSKSGWKIIADSSSLNPSNAIDENPGTIWNTLSEDSTVKFQPKSLAVDLGKAIMISSFNYLPRQDKKLDGMVDQYTFEVSNDGESWKDVAKGEFSNILSNPINQVINLQAPVSARYFKFTGRRSAKGNGITVAELGINGN